MHTLFVLEEGFYNVHEKTTVVLTKHFDLHCNDDCLAGGRAIIIARWLAGAIRRYVMMPNRLVVRPFNLLEL